MAFSGAFALAVCAEQYSARVTVKPSEAIGRHYSASGARAFALERPSIISFNLSSVTGPLSIQCARCAKSWSFTSSACKKHQ